MNRRDFIKHILFGGITLAIGNIVKPEKVDAFVVDESSMPKAKLHNTDCLKAIKAYCKNDAELAWTMKHYEYETPDFLQETKNYYRSVSEKLYQARLEAKRTGKAQIVAQQKKT